MLSNLFPTATLLLATTLLRAVSSLPSNPDPATPSNSPQTHPTPLTARSDSPNFSQQRHAIFSFHDLCPDNHAQSGWKQDADIYDYVPDMCRQVDAPGALIVRVDWNAGFHEIRYFENANCSGRRRTYHFQTDQVPVANCTVLPEAWKVLSLRGSKG